MPGLIDAHVRINLNEMNLAALGNVPKTYAAVKSRFVLKAIGHTGGHGDFRARTMAALNTVDDAKRAATLARPTAIAIVQAQGIIALYSR